MTKALVCTTTSALRQESYVYKLYGDPDHYAYEFGNETRFSYSLPIYDRWIGFSGFDFLHSMSIVYNTQQIYFGSNLLQRLEYGRFVYYNDSGTEFFFDFLPATNQVSLL